MEEYKQEVIELYNNKRYNDLNNKIIDTENILLSEMHSNKDVSILTDILKKLKIVERSKILLKYKIDNIVTYTPRIDYGLSDSIGIAPECNGNILSAIWKGLGLHFRISDGNIKIYEVWPKEIK